MIRRVVQRYLNAAHKAAAARPLKPEKLTALMLKIRKWAISSIKISELAQVLVLLGGWTLEEIYVLAPEGSHGPEYRFQHKNPDTVRMVWEQAKAAEVRSLPDPEHMKLHDTVFMDISEISALPSGDHLFTARRWQVSQGVRVTAPNHKTWECGASPGQFEQAYVNNVWRDPRTGEPFVKWLHDDTPLLDQINAKLDMDSYEVERQKAQTPPRTRENTGTCPCCYRNIKLTPRAHHGRDKSMPGMAVHGYRRPGTGNTYDHCFGEHWPPYELSREGTEAWLAQCLEWLKLSEEDRDTFDRHEMFYDQRGRALEKSKMVPDAWDKLYQIEFKKVLKWVQELHGMITAARRAIAAWEPKPLPSADGRLVEAMSVPQVRQTPGYCGPASLRAVLLHWGRDVSEDELARLSGTTRDVGVEAPGLVRAAKALGFRAGWAEGASVEDLRRMVKRGLPVIVDWFSTDEGHFSVVTDIGDASITLMDPELGGDRVMAVEDFERVWFDFEKPNQRGLNRHRLIVVAPA